jgi:tRNA(Ile2) C34 agmatinyltransferase TiaS
MTTTPSSTVVLTCPCGQTTLAPAGQKKYVCAHCGRKIVAESREAVKGQK